MRQELCQLRLKDVVVLIAGIHELHKAFLDGLDEFRYPHFVPFFHSTGEFLEVGSNRAGQLANGVNHVGR